MTTRRWLAVGLMISLVCGIQVNFVSTMLHPRFEHHEESLKKEQAVIHGQRYPVDGNDSYWPEFQNRVLFAIALDGVSRFPAFTPSQWYGILRLLFAITAFFVFWTALTKSVRAPPRLAAATMLLLAFVLAAHFNHGWEHPSDYLDPLLMTGFLWATLERRAGWLLLLCVVASLNRESAVFGGLLWASAYGVSFSPAASWRRKMRIHWREAFLGGAMMVVAYVCIVAARRVFGGDQGTQVLQHTTFNVFGDILISPFRHPTPEEWPLLLFSILTLPLIWIWANRLFLTSAHRGILLAGIVVFIVSSIFSRLTELRMLIPLSVMLIYVAACAETLAQTVTGGFGGAALRDSETALTGAGAPPALDKGSL